MSDQLDHLAESISSEAPAGLDLTDPSQLAAVQRAAERLLECAPSRDDLDRLEIRAIDSDRPQPLLLHLAIKLARSKRFVDAIDHPVLLSVVFAMYKENLRIQPRTPDNPVGEDFLRRKAQQLDWLTGDNPRVSWQLLAVDDGCPEGSGQIARQIAEEAGSADRVRVLFLENAIQSGEAVIAPISDTSESRKGGSILYGMATAARTQESDHVVLFTDADLSTHLGQSGLLMQPILAGKADAAIGSRREPTSVVVKEGRRNTRGKLFIYLWKQLLPVLQNIVDTQCGFKAFRADLIDRITPGSLEKGFAFDIELLLRTELDSRESIEKVPIAWIDSEAASTTTDLEPYLPMLQTTVALYRHYLDTDPRAESFAKLIDSLDENSWNRIIDRMPSAIADAEPAEFGPDSAITASDLAERLKI